MRFVDRMPADPDWQSGRVQAHLKCTDRKTNKINGAKHIFEGTASLSLDES